MLRILLADDHKILREGIRRGLEGAGEEVVGEITEVSAHRGQQELGRDVVTFRRENGIAENFHLEQNRDLLADSRGATGHDHATAGVVAPVHPVRHATAASVSDATPGVCAK